MTQLRESESHSILYCRSASAESPRSPARLQPVAAALVTAGVLPGTYSGGAGSGAPAAAAGQATPGGSAAGTSFATLKTCYMTGDLLLGHVSAHEADVAGRPQQCMQHLLPLLSRLPIHECRWATNSLV